jgi:hypothetical protein
MQEEVGLTVARSELRPVGPFQGLYGTNYLYEAELTVEPKLMVDRREIVSARFAPAKLARERHQYVRRHLYLRDTLRSWPVDRPVNSPRNKERSRWSGS